MSFEKSLFELLLSTQTLSDNDTQVLTELLQRNQLDLALKFLLLVNLQQINSALNYIAGRVESIAYDKRRWPAGDDK